MMSCSRAHENIRRSAFTRPVAASGRCALRSRRTRSAFPVIRLSGKSANVSRASGEIGSARQLSRMRRRARCVLASRILKFRGAEVCGGEPMQRAGLRTRDRLLSALPLQGFSLHNGSVAISRGRQHVWTLLWGQRPFTTQRHSRHRLEIRSARRRSARSCGDAGYGSM